MTDRRSRTLAAWLLIALAGSLAACGPSGSPASSPSPSSAPAISPGLPEPTAVPGGVIANPTAPVVGGGVDGGTGGSGTGGTGGNPGVIIDPGQLGGIFDPPGGPDGEPLMVTPVENVRDVREVNATKIEVAVDGRAVAVRVSWWSGVAPCTALAGIEVVRGPSKIALIVREGSAAAADVFCTEQAVHKAAIVDLGELEPGTWTISANGDAGFIEVAIPG